MNARVPGSIQFKQFLTVPCDPGEHTWVHGKCRICTLCHSCTGYGKQCCMEESRIKIRPLAGMSTKECGCGIGDAGCRDCGVCRACAQGEGTRALMKATDGASMHHEGRFDETMARLHSFMGWPPKLNELHEMNPSGKNLPIPHMFRDDPLLHDDDDEPHELTSMWKILSAMPDHAAEDDDSSSTSDEGAGFNMMCDPGKHSWIKDGVCRVCTFCNFCTGYGPQCCNEGKPGRDSGSDCGCGQGDAGCKTCGVCKVCAGEAKIPPSWSNMVLRAVGGDNNKDDGEDSDNTSEDDNNDMDDDDNEDGDNTSGDDNNDEDDDDKDRDICNEDDNNNSIPDLKQKRQVIITEDAGDSSGSTGAGKEVESTEVIVRRKQIMSRMEQEKFRKARGIIFIVGVGGADGTDVDVDNVEDTFKGLNFTTFAVHDPPADEISTIMKAAADPEIYPYRYQYVAFYFAGHGGKDQKDMFIVGLQKKDNEKEILYVNDHIISPLKCLHKRKISRLFFFDCCQSPGEGTAYRSAGAALKKKPKPHPGELVAYATSEGEKSFGDRKKGGIWTHHLCKNIREMNEPILTVLSHTYEDVVKARDSFQQPYLTAAIGTLRLKADNSAKHVQCNTIPGAADGKKPGISMQAVFNGLKSHSSQWSDFALELEIDDDFRDSLENDTTLTDDKKLESVITQWIEKKTCEVSWDKIVAVAKELQLPSATVDSLYNASKLPWRKIFRFFKQKASEWNSIANKLSISTSFCEDLEHNTSLNDSRKLEKVIREWIDNRTCEVTWDKIISVAKELGMSEEAKQLESVSKE